MPHYIHRDGMYLGSTGWTLHPDRALRFRSEDVARTGLDDLRKATPGVFNGSETIKAHSGQGEQHGIQPPRVDYDPFKVQR